VVRLAQQDVARNRPFEPGLEAAACVQQHHGFAFIGHAVHERRRHQHVAETDQAAQMMQRHLQALFALHVDAQGVVFEMRVGVGRHHVERVLQRVHGG
jgi:hypothetical protein